MRGDDIHGQPWAGGTELARRMGTFADALLGSVSQHVFQHARCPVVIMRGERKPSVPAQVG
jgi:hypothetical protein